MNLEQKIENIYKLIKSFYDFIVKAYTTFALDIFSLISSLIAIYRLDIKKGNSEKTE